MNSIDIVVVVTDENTVLYTDKASGRLLLSIVNISLLHNSNFIDVITVKVLDIDDSPPEFLDSEEWSFEVDEFDATSDSEFIPGQQKLVQRIQVNDPDSVSTETYFSITGTGVADGLLDFVEDPEHNPEGVLTVVKLIDRENQDIQDVNGILEYTITVSDNVGNTNEIQIEVIVNDLNDCVPQFEGAPYEKTIPENTANNSLVLTVSTIDLDVTSNILTLFLHLILPYHSHAYIFSKLQQGLLPSD